MVASCDLAAALADNSAKLILPWQGVSRLCSLLLSLQLLLPTAALGQNGSSSNSSSTGNASHNFNLNLSSTVHNITLGRLSNHQPVSIVVNGQNQTVNSTTMLTPAEAIAVREVLHGGQQSIVLGANGNAVGGSLLLNSHLSQNIASLVIPHGVTVVDVFSNSSTLNLSGNLVNSGSFYAVSLNPQTSGVTINASNIFNKTGGLISTAIPVGFSSGSFASSPSLNLTLNAANKIMNAGTISSSGSLSLNAVGSITNTSSGVIHAANNVNLTSNSGNFINNGLIGADAGNINFSSGQMLSDIELNSMGGTLQALNGDINFRDSSFTGAANIDITGGDYFSNNLNMYSGSGEITANLGQVSGNLNSQAAIEHTTAATQTLVLGNNNVAGDPTYANTGNIVISGANNFGNASVAILAGGNITSNSGANSGSISTNGGSVTLIAGADLTVGAKTGGSTVSGAGSSNAATGSVTVKFDSSHSGNIDLTASSTSTVIATNGGNLTLLANGTSASGTGNVWLQTSSTLNTSNSAGAGGNVVIYAGGTGGTASSGHIAATIQAGNIVTGGSRGASGSVTMSTAAPLILASSSAIFATNGTTSAQFTAGSSSAGSITTGSIDASNSHGFMGGDISLTAGTSISATALTDQASANSPASNRNGVISLTSLSSSTNDAISITNNAISAMNLIVTESGSITNTSFASGAGVNITNLLCLTAKNIAITSNLTAGMAITMNSSGSITDPGGNTLSSTIVTLQGATGVGTSAAPIMTNTTNLLCSSPNGSVYLQDSTSVNLYASVTGTGGTFNLLMNGSNLGIVLEGNINASATGTVVLSAGMIVDPTAATLTGSTITLIGSSGIGTSAARILTNTANLSANSSNGSVYLQDKASLNLGNCSTGTSGTFDLLMSGSNLNIALTGNVNASATGTVSLTNNTGGSITDAAQMTLTGSTIILTGSAGIGANGAPILLSGCAAPSATSSTGSVYLSDNTAITSIANISAAAGQTVSLTTTGSNLNITFNSNYTNNGGTIILNASGSVLDPGGYTLSAGSGTIDITAGNSIGTSSQPMYLTAATSNLSAGSGGIWLPSTTSTVFSGSPTQQISAVLAADWVSWTGSANGVLTAKEVGQLLLNPNITGQQAAVLGLIADIMEDEISSNGSMSYSPTLSLASAKSLLPSYVFYYQQNLAQISSATNSNGSFNLYGSYTGPQLSTIQQGYAGDCFYISAIDSLLNQNPQLIKNMITQNSNGSFTVTFGNGTKETFNLTDGEIASFSMAINNGCWLAVMGMAEAKVLVANPPFQMSAAQLSMPLGSVVDGGYPTQTLSLLTGQSYSTLGSGYQALSQYYSTSYINSILSADLANKTPIGVESEDHALAITGFNAQTGIVTIMNPWGVTTSYGANDDPGVMNPSMNVQMVNGVFTLTTAQMLADFAQITLPASIMSSAHLSGSGARGGFHTASMITNSLPGFGSIGASRSTGSLSLNPANINSSLLGGSSLALNNLVNTVSANLSHSLQTNTLSSAIGRSQTALTVSSTYHSDSAVDADSTGATYVPSNLQSAATQNKGSQSTVFDGREATTRDSFDPEDIVLFDGSSVHSTQSLQTQAYTDSNEAALPLQPIAYVLSTTSDTNNISNPISVQHGFAPSAPKDATTIVSASRVDANLSADAVIMATMRNGSVMFMPEKDMLVKTAHGQIKIGADSIVLVVNLKDGFAVYDMHDEHRGNVKVEASGETICLSPGRHVMITANNNSYEKINPLLGIGHRNLEAKALDANARQINSEFSLTSALLELKVLNDMKKSGTSKDAQVVNKLIKNAAIIMQLKGQQAPYRKYTSPTTCQLASINE